MPEHKEEVGAKFVLDDLASETLKKVREGFEHVHEKSVEVGKEMLSMGKQAAAFAVGFQLNSAIDSLKEFGEEVIHSSVALEDQNKELAGILQLVEKGERSFADLGDEAGELNERLMQMGVATGNVKGVMIDAFEMIGERSTKSAGHIEEMVGKMADAAKTLPGGLATLSAAWRDLESGMVRARNPLVSLMRQMGVVSGSATNVAQSLSKMMQEGKESQVFDLAEKAIDRMAAKTKNMPLTFSQLLSSMSALREGIFEAVGTPITEALGEKFGQLQRYMQEHRVEIEHLAHTIGVRVGEWVKDAARLIQQGFEYLKTHADDIMNALERGSKALMAAIAFMVQHKNLIIGLAVGKTVAGALPSGEGLAALGGAAGRALGAAPGVLAGAGAGVAAATAVAAAAWYEAYVQASKLSQETGLTVSAMLGHLGGGLLGASERMQNFNAKLRAVQADTDLSAAELEKFKDQMAEAGEAAVRAGDMSASAFNAAMAQVAGAIDASKVRDQLQQAADYVTYKVTNAAGASIAGGVDHLVDVWQRVSEHAANASEIMLGILGHQQNVLGALGAVTAEDALKKIKALAAGGVTGDAIKMPPINFGPSTFNIHQDFRDTDPERVMVVFKKGITKEATSRISSRVQTPFGY